VDSCLHGARERHLTARTAALAGPATDNPRGLLSRCPGHSLFQVHGQLRIARRTPSAAVWRHPRPAGGAMARISMEDKRCGGRNRSGDHYIGCRWLS